MNALHREVLDEATAALLARVGSTDAFRDFYLAGGTGLALQLGHRMSLDLALFSERPWSAAHLLDALRSLGPTIVDLQSEGILVGSVGGVRVSLLHYPFPLLEPVLRPSGIMPLAGLLDIAAMKLVAVGQRGGRKDFVDLYFLCREGVDVRAALEAMRRKMPGVDHNRVHIARSLAYFADAESEPEPRMLVPYTLRDARAYCLEWSRTLLREILEEG